MMDETAQFQDNGFQNNPYDYEPNYNQRGQRPTGYGANILQGLQAPSYNSNNSVLEDYQNDSDITISLGDLEKKVLKKSFPNDVVSNRLLRMELKIFNSTFTDDDQETRLDRISSAYQAQKTSKKYDSNKFAQHSAAAMQIGAILLMILAAIL